MIIDEINFSMQYVEEITKKLGDAIKCWNYKKKNKGSHKYEKDDLKVLK